MPKKYVKKKKYRPMPQTEIRHRKRDVVIEQNKPIDKGEPMP